MRNSQEISRSKLPINAQQQKIGHKNRLENYVWGLDSRLRSWRIRLTSLMLDGLKGKNPFAGEKPVIIMYAGIASADSIAWLSERSFYYLVDSENASNKLP